MKQNVNWKALGKALWAAIKLVIRWDAAEASALSRPATHIGGAVDHVEDEFAARHNVLVVEDEA